MINEIKLNLCWYRSLATFDNEMWFDSVLFEVVDRRRHCLLSLADGFEDYRVGDASIVF
jgi:hypothetical protein